MIKIGYNVNSVLSESTITKIIDDNVNCIQIFTSDPCNLKQRNLI